ncbi:hypothetical protein SETIT_5G015000v2 [Setaria italica]|uniref:aspartate--tRNA ligase n=1 Tax=Setaria italica TaxID=4555 RepID=A0A368R021_SETIT|nr:hypothetical protein SETIT_5G015000v2 [Setaria italica]
MSSSEVELAPATQPIPSKEQPKKSARKAERAAQRQQQQMQPPAAGAEDPFAVNYGDVPVEETQSKAVSGRSWAKEIRSLGRMAFVVLREGRSSVQCVLAAGAGASKQMVAFAKSLTKESVVDVEGVVSFPEEPLYPPPSRFDRLVEIQVRKIYCISRAIPTLPFNLEDAARGEAELEKPKFRVLWSKDFDEIHTPKLLSGASEGGAAVFKLMYNGQPACLAQSPQLHKQMAIVGGCRRVFEVGPVFRAETSRTHKHLHLFFTQVCDVIDGLFVSIFKHLAEKCKEELETINSQYPFEPLKVSIAIGEEIISGAQRIHVPGMLPKRAEEVGIEASTMSAYMESFSFGAPLPVMMLLCGLDNVRMVSMFPRDPHRLSP